MFRLVAPILQSYTKKGARLAASLQSYTHRVQAGIADLSNRAAGGPRAPVSDSALEGGPPTSLRMVVGTWASGLRRREEFFDREGSKSAYFLALLLDRRSESK